MRQKPNNDYIKKVLVTWLIKTDKKSSPRVHCQMNIVYANLFGEKGLIIDFGNEGGYWPVSDYTYIPPDKIGHLVSGWGDRKKQQFAEKNGVYVMFVKPMKYKISKKLNL